MFLAILLLIFPGLAQAALAWDALPAAIDAAPGNASVQAEAVAFQARRLGTGRSFVPRVEAYAQQRAEVRQPGANDSWTETGLRANLNLWRRGRDQAKARQWEAQAAQALAQAQVSKQALLLQARLTWLEAWQARSSMQALQEALLRGEEDLKRSRRQAQAGLVPRSDVLALETLADELGQHLFDESHLADEAEHHLAALLGLPAEEAEALVEATGHAWPTATENPAIQRFEQSSLEQRILALEAQSRAGEGLWQPSLDLMSDLGVGRQGYALGEVRDWQALAVFSLAWDPASAGDKEKAWLQGQAQSSRLALEAQVRGDAVKLAELKHALASWVARRGAVEKRIVSTQAFRQAVLEENSRGVRDSRDLMDSNQALLEAQQDQFTAQVRAWGVWSELQAFEAEP